MEYESVFQSSSRVLRGRNAIRFDPMDSTHRKAYATWELTGRWPIRFLTEWPFVTVPQTVMSSLARYVCSNEFKSVAEESGIELKPGFDSYFSRAKS